MPLLAKHKIKKLNFCKFIVVLKTKICFCTSKSLLAEFVTKTADFYLEIRFLGSLLYFLESEIVLRSLKHKLCLGSYYKFLLRLPFFVV